MSRIGRALRDRGVQRRMGAAALSGVLLALAFPAFDIGALALVALVPLIWAWRGATPARAALYGFVFGVVFAGILMYWLWYFGIVAIVPVVAAWAAFTALSGYLVGCLNRAGLRSAWFIAAAWVVPEALRARWPFGVLPGTARARYPRAKRKLSGSLTEHPLAPGDRLRGPYDLVVFPESSLDDFSPESSPRLRSRLVAVGERHGADVLANAAVPAPDGRQFNQNQLYEPNGRLAGTYAKEHLVPFGEYVPFRSLVDWTGIVDRIPYDYSPGKTRTIFPVKGHRLASVICFESAFAPLVRDFVHRGAEVVVVSTNNRSYRRSANAAQHIAQTQMRAAETGRPFLQASISGISAVIDADGDVRNTTKLFQRTVVTDTVTTTTGETPYVRFGEWVVAVSALLLLGAAVVSRVRRPRAAFPRLADEEREPVGSGRVT